MRRKQFILGRISAFRQPGSGSATGYDSRHTHNTDRQRPGDGPGSCEGHSPKQLSCLQTQAKPLRACDSWRHLPDRQTPGASGYAGPVSVAGNRALACPQTGRPKCAINAARPRHAVPAAYPTAGSRHRWHVQPPDVSEARPDVPTHRTARNHATPRRYPTARRGQAIPRS